MRENCVRYLLVIFIFWIFQRVLVIARKSEKNQQTFVVRYRNGDQTIPVTVVLDDKKQTEYVINMSPRTPDKSVTLYDFRQRTIAYKDLTNRECFLGRLTDETLKHEKDALVELQSPIESNPKILSLDPQRSALTPTEIRNIAGQKTAVFCRKMNTWLIMPKTDHSLRKREVDEIEETTYRRHGFHTVQFAHYGQETKRRYRKPRPTVSQLGHESEKPSFKHNENQNLGLQKVNETVVSGVLPLKFDERARVFENDFHKHNPSHNLAIKTNENRPFSAINNFNTESPIEDLNIHALKIGENHDRYLNFSNLQSAEEDESRVYNPNTNALKEHNNEKENPETDFRFRSTNFHNEPLGNFSTRYRNIEKENDRNDNLIHFPTNRHIPGLKSFEESTENPDVSINVLEVPKITAKFENVNNLRNSHQTPIQPNEDVHGIFERFHNIHPSVNEYPQNPISIQSNLNQNKENTAGNDLESFKPVVSSFSENFLPYEDTYQEHALLPPLPTSLSEITTETEYFTTNTSVSLNNAQTIPSNFLHTNRMLHNFTTTSKQNGLPLTSNLNTSKEHKESNIGIYNQYSNPEIFRKKYIYLHPPTTTIREGIAPNQLRFPSILRQYKPEEIIIDIEKIPTQKPPDSVSRFHNRQYSLNQNSHLQVPSHAIPKKDIIRSGLPEVISRNNRSKILSNTRRINTAERRFQNNIHSSPSRNIHLPKLSAPSSSDYRRYTNPSARTNFPTFFVQPPRLETLPPGVSLHPRHPQAPYANMVHTNTLNTFPRATKPKILKPHRQRHHKKKDRNTYSCCRHNERSPCCSRQAGNTIRPDASCCSYSKFGENNVIRHELPRTSTRQPQQLRDTLPLSVSSDNKKFLLDKRDRCQKEKMCRTLYESTQQVIVCRNINIEGC